MNSRIADDVKVVNEEKMGTKTFSGDIYAVLKVHQQQK